MARATIDDVPALAVYPGNPHSVHLTSVALPAPGPHEAVVKVRQVGICGTDREIIEGKFGTPPPGSQELILGHEVFGVVEAVGSEVANLSPGDLVGATVRRPDDCAYCRAGQPDMCQTLGYVERGIIGLHGFMAERIVDRAEHLVPVPAELASTAVLLEPLSIVEKAVRQANLIQRRMAAWAPKTAVVLGAGPIGILGTFLLRSRGLEVYTLARTPAPTPNASLVEACGAHYVSTRETPFRELAGSLPNIDIILEATGYGPLAFDAMNLLGNNGVLVWLSIIGGDDASPLPYASILRGHVLGNKVTVGSVNSSHEDFTLGVADLGSFEHLWPGLTEKLITHRLHLDEAAEIGIGHVIEGSVKAVIDFDSV
jgi:threonine dehydrogenase-like Zn-dependent dehydrogenase